MVTESSSISVKMRVLCKGRVKVGLIDKGNGWRDGDGEVTGKVERETEFEPLGEG